MIDHAHADDAHNRVRDGQGQFVRSLENHERDTRAVALRARGATYQQIADELDYADRSTAHRAVKALLLAIPAEEVAELRRVEGERLEHYMREALAVLERDHLHVSQGGKIVLDEEGKRLLDDGPKLAAIRELRMLSERRAKLFGLDAPTVLRVDAVKAMQDAEAAREEELQVLIEDAKRRLRAKQEAAGAAGTVVPARRAQHWP